ncbi:MAG: YqgE/AlgH family protein, partial [Verrucomicrobia bacterium]|nr:YqgE/AlgH family protein [Verrucomicrobiota bacterium]
LELPEEILNLNDITNPHVHMRAGGPVQTNQMMILHTHNETAAQTLNVCDGVYLGGDLQFLQEVIQDEAGPRILLCFGYAGWTAGQLEREFLDGSWYIYSASEKHIFHTPPEKLWRALLREMGGRYATLSMLPDDLSVN